MYFIATIVQQAHNQTQLILTLAFAPLQGSSS